MPDRNALVAQWWPLIRKFACRYRRWAFADTADDLAGEIAARALRYFPGFRPERAKFPTWLGRVALSTAARMRELNLRRRNGEAASPRDGGHRFDLDADPGAADPSEVAAKRLDHAALVARVQAAFHARLSAPERAAVRRRFGLGGEPQGPGRHSGGRGLRKLREHLAAAG